MRANGFTIPVLHAEWKSLKPVKIVTTLNKESGEIEELLVDESYVLNKEAVDISIKTYWIPFKLLFQTSAILFEYHSVK